MSFCTASKISQPQDNQKLSLAEAEKKIGVSSTIVEFDQVKWNALLKYDSDIALIADKIRPFGKKWLNEFASSYFALNDKQYLPEIERKILDAARKEAEEKEQEAIAIAKTAAERKEQLRIRSEEQRKTYLQEQEHRSQARKERNKLWRKWFNRNRNMIIVSGFTTFLIAIILVVLWQRDLKIKEEEVRLARGTAESQAHKYVIENAIICNGFPYIKIRNVFTKFSSRNISVAIHEADENWTWASFEVWSSGDAFEYEEGKGWVKSELLLFGMTRKSGQWIQEGIQTISSCSDIQSIVINVPTHSPRPLSGETLNDKKIDSTTYQITPKNDREGSEHLSVNRTPWIFENSDKKYLTDDEVRNLPIDDLWKARNEIYAKKGYTFKTDRGRQYAKSLGIHYSGIEPDMNKVYQQLNIYEKQNIKLIEKYEK